MEKAERLNKVGTLASPDDQQNVFHVLVAY